MRINSKIITIDFLDALDVKDKPYFIKVIEFKGLRIKVNPNGRISYITYARLQGGNPRTITHGTTKSLDFPKAVDLHIRAKKLLEKGIDPNLLKKTKKKQFYNSIKFIDIANEYLIGKKSAGDHSFEHSRHNHNYLLSKKLRSFHNDSMESITVEKLEIWYRNNKHTPAATKNALMLISKIFKHATMTGFYHLQNNPAIELRSKLIITGQKTTKKQLDINDEYPEYLYHLCDPMSEHKINIITRNIIYLMTITGLKKNDLLMLKKEQITGNSHITIKKRDNFIQIVPITDDIQRSLTHTNKYLKAYKNGFESDFIFYNPKTNKPISNLRKSLSKLSSSFEWNIYPESIRKSFSNMCDQSSIPRKHYYQLLGIRESYIPHADNTIEYEQIQKLRESLTTVQDNINKLCPMIVPGKYDRISDIIFQ